MINCLFWNKGSCVIGRTQRFFELLNIERDVFRGFEIVNIEITK